MPNVTRTFTVAELEEIGVPRDLTEELAVADEQVSSGRWSETRRCLFRHDGRVWALYYQQGLTEYQEVDNFGWDDTVTATAVEEQQVTVTKWVPVVANQVTS
jgi:hypothetical protein